MSTTAVPAPTHAGSPTVSLGPAWRRQEAVFRSSVTPGEAGVNIGGIIAFSWYMRLRSTARRAA